MSDGMRDGGGEKMMMRWMDPSTKGGGEGHCHHGGRRGGGEKVIGSADADQQEGGRVRVIGGIQRMIGHRRKMVRG